MIVYRELSSLEQDLGISAKTLYAVSNNLSKHYRKAKLPKKSGGFRNLSVPDEVLKSIQKQIAEVLLIHSPTSRYAKAYRFGSSTLRNAKHHVGKQVVLKLDILHFFDSIRYSTVKDKVFPEEIYAEPLRILLTMLCYHKDALPQGAPSSPAVTNIILYDFDEKVGAFCAAKNIAYTRYCDDMTFSDDFDPKEVIAKVQAELGKLHLFLNEKKTVVLNLESANKEVSRRMIDFLCGAAYANHGKMKRVANNTYIITPYNVDIMGDLLDELEHSGVIF